MTIAVLDGTRAGRLGISAGLAVGGEEVIGPRHRTVMRRAP
jgi:hypothetical protein